MNPTASAQPAGHRAPRALPTPARQPSVRFDAVSFSYGRTLAVDRVVFALLAGELAYLVGPSASGKTTLLRLAHGELRPVSGELEVAGLPVHRIRRGQVRRLRRRVGVVYQDHRLLARLTALENVAYALRVADLALPAREARRRAAEALDQVGLGDRLDACPRQLSGGQQQRVAIARAVAARPAVLLADEPTANLDTTNADRVLGLMERLADEGTAVLIATCDLDLAMPARRVIRLADGAVIEDRVPVAGGPRLCVLP